MMLDLSCPVCKKVTHFEILPWQTEAGRFGAVSILCSECNTLEIFKLGEGVKIEFGDDDETV